MDFAYSTVCGIKGPFNTDDGRCYVEWFHTNYGDVRSSVVFYDDIKRAKAIILACKSLLSVVNPQFNKDQTMVVRQSPVYEPIVKEMHPNRKSKKHREDRNKKEISFLENTFLANLRDESIIGVCALCGNLLHYNDKSDKCGLVHSKCAKDLGNRKPNVRKITLPANKKKNDNFSERLICSWIDESHTKHKNTISIDRKNKLVKVVSIMIEKNIKMETIDIYDSAWKKVNKKSAARYTNHINGNKQRARGGKSC
jgi:hypothetical protein